MQSQALAAELAKFILQSNNTVFFGGAGVSTESGIPDFRSEEGLFRARRVYGYSPEELLSHTLFTREPELFFKYYKENLIFLDAKPNAAHIALSDLESHGLLCAVITQNIDGLHDAAGSRQVLELHGSKWRQYCIGCGEKYPLAYILDASNCDGHIPKCKECGGNVRPDVVLYEESLNEAVLSASIKAISKAELLIVGGTSLAVYPAAGLLRHFKGKSLVIINKSQTPGDNMAELVINDAIGTVLSETIRQIIL